MKVKIGELMFDSNDTPVMVVFDESDLKDLKEMLGEGMNIMVLYPDNLPPEQITAWVDKEPQNINDGATAILPISIAIQQLTNRIVTVESAIANLIRLS